MARQSIRNEFVKFTYRCKKGHLSNLLDFHLIFGATSIAIFSGEVTDWFDKIGFLMLTIETDMVVFYNNQECKVFEGGEFMETELVTIYISDDPEKKPIYALQAYWILNHKHFDEE